MGGEPVKGDEVMEVNGESAGKGREEAGVKGERGGESLEGVVETATQLFSFSGR